MRTELSCVLDVQEPELEHVTTAVQQLVGFMRDHGVTDTIFLSQFELAAAEAINNAVEHGCSPDSKERFFRARLQIRPNDVELRVLDPSSFTGWEAPPQLPDDPFDEGGRGHFLMSQMMDELIHETENGCHVLILRKKFTEGPWEYIPGEADRTLSEMTDELVSSYEMISTLLGLGEWLATAPEMVTFTEGALARLCEVTGGCFAYVRFEKGGKLQLMRISGEANRELIPEITAGTSSMEWKVFESGQEITLPPGSQLPPNDPACGIMDSGFITPVLFKEERRGVLLLGKCRPANFFDAGQLKIARTVAEYLGLTAALAELQRKRQAEDRALHDLEIAAQIQNSLMPQEFSSCVGLDLYGACRPALQAGGDYFDVLTLPDGSIMCMIADVMGKGLSAALLALMLRTNLRAVTNAGIEQPCELLKELNELMSRDLIKLEMFITVVCARISADRSIIDISSAGHCASIIQRASAAGEIESLSAGGLPLGIMEMAAYSEDRVAFEAGDRLLLFTDGIIEASSPDDRFFDEEGVLKSLAKTVGQSSRISTETLLDDVNQFSENAPPSDDRTIILVTRTK